MEVVVTTAVIKHAKLQSNRRYQQTNIQLSTGRCPACHPPTVFEHPLSVVIHIHVVLLWSVVHLRSRLMLMLVSKITNQDRIYVQCATNGLQRNGTWMPTASYTVDKTCIQVVNVRKVFRRCGAWSHTWMVTATSTSAVSVESVIRVIITLQNTDEVIRERNRLCVLCVTNALLDQVAWLYTVEFTVERNHTNVSSVTRPLDISEICTSTWQCTGEINRTNVHCVVRCSASPTVCVDMNALYTVVRLAEDNLLTFCLLSAVQHKHRRRTVLFQFIWTTLRCLITKWLMFQQ